MAAVGLITLGMAGFLSLGAFSCVSSREGERRAAVISFGLAVALAALFFLAAVLLPNRAQFAALGFVALVSVAGIVAFPLPVGRVERGPDSPSTQYDERDIMFARARLEPGSTDYDDYYAMRPGNKANDDRTRSLPGLLSLEASEANPLIFAATAAAFGLTGALRDAVDGAVAPTASERDPEAMSDFIKNLALYHGAHSAGVTELEPYHVYSHIGRGSGVYGTRVRLEHRYAIAFSVEMDYEMVRSGPAAPTVLESARQYVEAAKIAIELANLCRILGYSARAHIDGNYRIVVPLVARDAGLGEIGRMGLLMTPTLGPRVRLGAVTTDLPLVPDARRIDDSVIDFCTICEKCADSCPVRAIPSGPRVLTDGVLRWKINADICFRYWNVVGTDCGHCMAVCPYSHPNSFMHNAVRWAVQRSGMARRGSLWLDDLFYGKKPPPRPAYPWLPKRAVVGSTTA
jgi:ferredoxin